MTATDLEPAQSTRAGAETGDGGDSGDSGISPARLGSFSDGILAIAATLLILDVAIPQPGQEVWASLRQEWPALAAYASTFLIIGIVWIHHHNLFSQVRSIDRTLMFLNLGMLLTIAFLPLPTATLGDHLGGGDGQAAAIFYGLSMVVASGWFALFWYHLGRHPELLFRSARDGVKERRRTALVGPIAFLVATLAAFVSAYATIAVSAIVIAFFILAPAAPAAATRVDRS